MSEHLFMYNIIHSISDIFSWSAKHIIIDWLRYYIVKLSYNDQDYNE